MERIQLILLILLSSAYFLTCGKPGEKDISGMINSSQPDSLPGNNSIGQGEAVFSSSWLTLPFSGSGTNWLATINVPSLVEEILLSHEVKVYLRKSGTVYNLSDGDPDQKIDVIAEPGKIIISSDTYPDDVQFRYIISPGGIAGETGGLNSMTALRKN